MKVEHHDLHHEFPEYRESIHELKLNNNHFAKLFGEYHELTAKVEQLEGTDVPVDDATITDLRKTRLKLKDELYNMLRNHAA